MSGERPFDDGRWPDEEGFAECFLCGKKIDPLDPNRGTYTPNHRACEGLPIHLRCAAGRHPMVIYSMCMTALNEMTDVQAKRRLELANVVTTPPRPLPPGLH